MTALPAAPALPELPPQRSSAQPPRTVQGWIRWLVVACIVPSWLLAVWVSIGSYERERAAAIDSAARRAQAWMLAVERDLAIDIAVLQTLATSTLIDDADRARFQAFATEAVRQRTAHDILLIEPELQPLGSPDARTAGKPAVSDLFLGESAQAPLLAVVVPVQRQGSAVARLELNFSPQRFAKLLAEQGVPPGWSVVLWDRLGQVIVDSRRPERRERVQVPAAWREAAARTTLGCTPGEGATQLCLGRSPTHGWTLAVEVPDALLGGSLRRTLLQGALGSAALLLVGLALARTIGRSITRPIQSLLAPAAAIGHGEPADIRPSTLKEPHELGLALQQAQQLLGEREQARRTAVSSLEDSRRRLRMALEAAGIGDWEVDLQTYAVSHSARHDQCFGYAEPITDWSLQRFLDAVHPEDRQRLNERVQAALASGVAWREDIRVRWPDGSEHWLLAAGLAIHENGQPRRMVGIVLDISERLQSEDLRLHGLRLEIEHEQIQQANRLKSEFLTNMSHELRTPLNAVIGFAEILQAQASSLPPAQAQAFLAHIERGGQQLLRLINDVLDLSKVESGKFEFFPEPLDAVRLVDEVIEVLQAEADRKSIELSRIIDPALTDLLLDPARLKQVLYNLLSNAIKYTGSGGRVRLRLLAATAQLLRLEVQDDGIGIAAAEQEHLFEPFQQMQAGSPRAQRGSGLGLALTRRLVEGQGGSVGVRSSPGQGSLFFALLPRRADAAAAPQTLAPVPPVAAGSPRILVVEDEVADQARLVQALTRAGFEVDLAATGAQALERAGRVRYDAVTLDLLLPDCSGLDVLARLRTEGRNAQVPVVVVTMVTETSALAGFQVDDVLIKPIDGDSLVAALRRLPLAAQAAPRVMVVDDDPLAQALMASTLAAVGLQAIAISDGAQALARLPAEQPAAMVLDLTMPGLTGFEVLATLRGWPEFALLPVFIWTSAPLTPPELARLAQSAQVIVNKGQGSVDAMAEHLRQWRARLQASVAGAATPS